MQAQADLGDHAERALGADEQAREVVARRRFACAAARADDAAVGEHHGEPEHVLAHRAVAHRVGARRAGRGHAADAGIGAGIDREEQPGIAQLGIELLARDAGLYQAVEVGGVDLAHGVHLHEIEGDAAAQRGDVALERCAGAVGDHGHALLRADRDDGADLLGGAWERHPVGRRALVIGLVAAMLLAHGQGGAEPVAQHRPQRRSSASVAISSMPGPDRLAAQAAAASPSGS